MVGPVPGSSQRDAPAPAVIAFIGAASAGLPLASRRLVWTAPSPPASQCPVRFLPPLTTTATTTTTTIHRRTQPLRATMAPGPNVAGNGSVNLDAAAAPPLTAKPGNGAALGTDGAATTDAPAATPSAAAGALALSGAELLRNGSRSQGLRYTAEQRAALGLTGLLPPTVETLPTQVMRVMRRLGNLRPGLDQWEYLASVDTADERLFYATVLTHLTRIMPLIYTPVVGAACQNYGRLYVRPRGIFLSIDSPLSTIAEAFANWPERDVRVIVMTDGERILGLGDLGAHGHGIPVGKLSLYVACGGIHPRHTLPITLDCGTNNEELLADPTYLGARHPRVRGEKYDNFVEAVLAGAVKAFGRSVALQFEDFANANAARLLALHRDSYTIFNDDIQGTASVATAGVLAALKMDGVPSQVREHTFLFLGAGSAGIGIAELLSSQMLAEDEANAATGNGDAAGRERLTREAARARCYFLDSKGIVAHGRKAAISAEKEPFAQRLDDKTFANLTSDTSLLTAVETLKPTALIGVSTVHGAFSAEVLRAMAAANERPLVFALSNPTSKSECTATEAVEHTDGRVVFASGSPFDPVPLPSGRMMEVSQGNNALCFPGIGAGVVLAGAATIPDALFLTTSQVLADEVSAERLAAGALYPPMEDVRRVSAVIALAVARAAAKLGVATRDVSGLTLEGVLAKMYDPQRDE